MLDEQSKQPAGIVGGVVLEGDRARVVVRGEVDIASAEQLRSSLMGCLEAGCRSLALEMASVTFLDSTGLRILVETGRRLHPRDLILVNPSPMVRRLIEITGLDEMLRMEPAADSSNGHVRYTGRA